MATERVSADELSFPDGDGRGEWDGCAAPPDDRRAADAAASRPHRRRFDIKPASAFTASESETDLSAAPADADQLARNAQLAPVAALLRRESTYRRLLAAADGLGALGAVVLWGALSGAAWRWCFLAIPPIAIAVAKVQGLYDNDDMVINKRRSGEWRVVARHSLITAIGGYIVWYLSTSAAAGRGLKPLFCFTIGTFVLTVPLRALARALARARTCDERVLVVGAPNHCEQLAERLTSVPHTQLVGMVDDSEIDNSVPGLRITVERLQVQRIVIGPYPSYAEDWILRLVASAKWLGVRVSLMPSIMAVVGANTAVDKLDTMILLGVPRFGLSSSSEAVKRAFDIVIGTLVLALSAPVFALVALAVKLDSPGPVFFRQRRIGRDGEPFTMYKFRSMVDGAEALRAGLDSQNETNGLFKMENDPRVTRVGKIIRKTYLDELPQLINVLKGDMSLVGPRPLIESEDALLTGIDRHRSCLPPGMTGPWQLRGPIDASMSELAKLDYHYASNWSVWSDLDILISTVARVLHRGGH